MKRWTSGPGLRSGAAAVAVIAVAALAYFSSVGDGTPVSDSPTESASQQITETTDAELEVDPAAIPLTTCSLGCGGTHE